MDEKPTPPQSAAIKLLEAGARLIASLAWPLLILFVFLSLRHQITAVFSAIPTKLSESTKFAIGSLSFEMNQTAKQTGDPQLPKLIEELSANALTVLMVTGNSSKYFAYAEPGDNEYFFPGKDTLDAMNELEKKKMLTFDVPMEQYMKSIADLGFDTRVKESVDELVRGDPQMSYGAGRKLTGNDVKALQRQQYKLSASGKKAFRLVVDAVTKNLK